MLACAPIERNLLIVLAYFSAETRQRSDNGDSDVRDICRVRTEAVSVAVSVTSVEWWEKLGWPPAPLTLAFVVGGGGGF